MSVAILEHLTGTVRFFNSRTDKRYGFIIPDNGGSEIFFHLNNGKNIFAGQDSPAFDVYGRLDRTPQAGDRVVYTTVMGSKGPVASPWGFEVQYKKALAIISERLELEAKRVLLNTILMILWVKSRGCRDFHISVIPLNLTGYTEVEQKFPGLCVFSSVSPGRFMAQVTKEGEQFLTNHPAEVEEAKKLHSQLLG